MLCSVSVSHCYCFFQERPQATGKCRSQSKQNLPDTRHVHRLPTCLLHLLSCLPAPRFLASAPPLDLCPALAVFVPQLQTGLQDLFLGLLTPHSASSRVPTHYQRCLVPLSIPISYSAYSSQFCIISNLESESSALFKIHTWSFPYC